MSMVARWLLEFENGGHIALRGGVTLVGRSSACDVVLDDPAVSRRQLLLHARIDGVELVNVGRQPVSCDGRDIDDATLAGDGARIAIGGSPLATIRRREADPQHEASTALGPRRGCVMLRLESYIRGGVLTVTRGDEQRSVYLAALRFALIRALLCPVPPASPGDFVSVEQLCRVIWPDDKLKDESDFGVLLYRLRHDLLRAEFDVDEVIERARGTGMIRAPIARNAHISIE